MAVKNQRKSGAQGSYPIRHHAAMAWPKGMTNSRPNPRRKRASYENNKAVRSRQSHPGK